ncbi:P-loop containing nucleoside triphosphate hydrolase protein [Mycena pura]|uniref:P-loop containing nucleoside triphosphate hydrolase protein n=1 Tax=Mycena pura TaxID=153505 RepID=A0AAD6VP45_9AGAR|nr:P-loop containing nucleoside triphosphate hydrolase protein [Mycena pura]
MELPRMPLDFLHQQVPMYVAEDGSPRGYASPSSGLASATSRLLGAPELLQRSSLLTGAFLVAIAALVLCVSANRKVPRCLPKKLDILVCLKIVFSALYVTGTAVMLVYAQKDLPELVSLSTAAAAAISFAVTSISEHYHSVAPSTLTSLYAIIGTAFYAYPLRSLCTHPVYLRADTAVVVCLFVLVFLESKSKRDLLLPMDPPPAYESTLSFLVKPFFPHIVPILYTGSRRRITLPELHDIPSYLRSDPATEKLLAALAVEDKTSNRYLIKSTFRAFGGHFLGPVLPGLIIIAGNFVQVTLVEQMIKYVSDKSIPIERGTWLIAAYFVVYVSLTIANYVYSEKIYAFMVLYRSGLTGSLYAKTLSLTSMAAREVGQGAATTYMSVDVEKVTNGFQTFQELWSSVVTIVVACTMLWYKAGIVMFAPLLLILILLGTTSSISSFVGAAQKAWLHAIDVRIKLLTSVLSQLLPIKLGAYETALAEKINALRKLETEALGHFVRYIAVASTLSNIGGSASFLVTLAAYALMRAYDWGSLPPLDVSRIFALVTIVDLLNGIFVITVLGLPRLTFNMKPGPLNSIGQQLPTLFASFASLKRIQGFLQLPEKAQSREAASGAEADCNDGSAAASKSQESTAEVSMTGCTFAWDDKTHVLRDITLELAPRELHMVVGPVASGKSSLLMSILEETRLVEGKVKVKARKVALAGQTAFIYPGTFRANILLDSAYEEVFYDQVIHACGLRQDIEALPRRDMTKLSDKGSTLSGGQRQRLALARAVYARADLILLDDVFSALDGETEAHVFASLFGPDGMLKGKTTVLITHGIHHLPSADKVIVMDVGTISHFGSLDEVRAAGATFALASFSGEAENGQVADKENATAATVVEDDEEEEELNWAIEQVSTLDPYEFYSKCTGVARSFSLIGLITLGSGFGIFVMAYPSLIATAPSNQLGLWVAGYGAVVALNLLSMALTLLYFGYILSSYTAPNIHSAELAGIMGSPISWITKNPVGKILNRFSQDIQVADRDFPFAFLNFAYNVLGTLGSFVFIVMATPLLVFSLPFLAILVAYFLRYYLATSKQFRRLESASKSPLYTLFGTTVSGLISVRAYRAEGFFKSRNAEFVNESQGALHYRLGGQLFLKVFLLWLQAILACGTALLTVLLRDSTSAAFLGLSLSRLVSLGVRLGHLLSSYALMENGSVAIDRIQEFANLPEEEEIASTKTSDDITINVIDELPWPSAGSLMFSDFSMKYREDLPFALKNLSFNLQGGQKIGICGRTGSGKSSTVLALFRGIDQHLVSGKIVIDGVDISTVPIKQIRESMRHDPFLWHGSIRENLDITNECTDSEIWEILKLVQMYDAVSALDDKLQHLVVDEESFSKGQRQLLCLARAMLRKKKIIVLDESTSSMDHITDEKIRHVVDTQTQGLTVLAIAHRISTIVNYDKILVLDSGSVAEFDNPRTLLANPESRFARLAATQGIYHHDFVPIGAAVKELSDKTVVVTEDLIDVV